MNKCNSVKLDAIYKPILRRFRKYFRAKFDETQKNHGYIHWTAEKYFQNLQIFVMRDLKLPPELQDDQSVVKVLTLVFPCTLRRPLPNMLLTIDRVLFAKVFRENNNTTRYKFFSDPLIKYLWSQIFIKEDPEILITQLRRLRSQEDLGEAKQDRLTKDMMVLELKLNFKMLPDMVKSPNSLPAFSS